MNFQNLFSSYSSFGFNQRMNLNSFKIFDSRDDLKKTIPIRFNKVHGVYIFEHTVHGIIYIGSSGKVPSNNKSQGIRNRILQGYTPYKLNGQVLDYVFKGGSENNSVRYLLSEITIHIIELDKNSFPISIPSVMEHLLIQFYHNSVGIIPEINKKI